MSKKIFLAFGLLAIVSLSSCRKNRTCSCTTTITSAGESTITPQEYVISDVNQEEGEAACLLYTKDNTFPNFSEKVDCTLN
ncbi:MAG: hypothetical protein AB8B74_01500 [Crocinitomicaceae bacterium]